MINKFEDLEKSAIDLSRCFPTVFQKYNALLCVPFGWHRIMYKYGPQLEREARRSYEELDDLTKECTPTPLHLTSAKEKWGRLDLSFSYYSDTIIDISNEIEDESLKVCLHCGKSGNCTSIGGWYLTLCDECREGK